jgi:hypothetical protein
VQWWGQASAWPMRSSEPLYCLVMLLIRLRFCCCFDELLPHLQPYPPLMSWAGRRSRCAARGVGGACERDESCALGLINRWGPAGVALASTLTGHPPQLLLPSYHPADFELFAD